MDEKIRAKIELLEGVTYLEWQKIKMVMDRSFDIKRSKLERQLKLTPDEINYQVLP